MTYTPIKLKTSEDGIGIIEIGNSADGMNILSEKTLLTIDEIVSEVEKNSRIKGLVFISGNDDHFIVGADINEITSFSSAEEAAQGSTKMQAVFNKIEKLKIPTVAAINGPCLGGGLELSLACSWRIATSRTDTKLGFPEIQLGFIPGAGGTQRAPRLIGIQSGLDMILTARKIPAKKALKIGLVDAVVPQEVLLEQASLHATKSKKSSSNSISSDLPTWAIEGNTLGRKVMAKKAREMVEDKTKGFYPASFKAIDAVFEGFDQPLDKGLAVESKTFGSLVMTKESQALVHLYFATTDLKKRDNKDDDKEKFENTDIASIGVIGSGLMGAGISIVSVDKHIRVLLADPNESSIATALQTARKWFQKKVDQRRLKPFEMIKKISHISPGRSSEGLENTDLVIEAVFEDLNLKQKLLRDLEKNADDDWIFASNTSAIPISKIAEVARKPERVLGMHFFSPVEKMPLLEIVETEKTAKWATARAVRYGQRIGKQVIVVKDGPGFYTTRALAFFLSEAAHLLIEGVSVQDIDSALTKFGFPVGPITLIDEVGIDVAIHVLQTMNSAFPERIHLPKGLLETEASGKLGRKNKNGFYSYDSQGKKLQPDEKIYGLLNADSRKKLSEDVIVDRCLFQFINESVRCLDEQVLRSPGDGDVGAVFGLGFPPFLGGPFKYCDAIGMDKIITRMEALSAEYGERFKPVDTLVKMAKENELFFPKEADPSLAK